MSTATATTVAPTATTNATTALTQPTPGSLPATYVESDPAQRNEAKLAHWCGVFGIVGTGIFYVVKKDTAGAFVKDQVKEAFNFHLLVFCAAIALNVVAMIAMAVVGIVGMVVSLAVFALIIGALVLSILNGLKAGNGQVARYPARLSVLK